MSVKVMNVYVDWEENANCETGRFSEFDVVLSNYALYKGITCPCGKGCCNTDKLPKIGMKFKSVKDFENYLNS